MTRKSKLIISGIGISLVSLALTGTAMAANGQGFGNRGENRPQMTAEQMAEHQKEMRTKTQESLAIAVTDGKLTEDQKAYILTKKDEIHTKMVAGDRAGADKLRNELRTWSQENGIDQTVMPMGTRGQGMRGQGRHQR